LIISEWSDYTDNMKLIIKNISSIKKNTPNKSGIIVDDVVVEKEMYVIYFSHPIYWGKWELVINRIKENRNDSYDLELINMSNTGNWERYNVSANQILNSESFFHRLNEMCHDYDIINNK
jgi:hypothetical protein